MIVQTEGATIAAGDLRPSESIYLYGGVVYVCDVVALPLTGPATHVKITYRKDFAEGHLIGQAIAEVGRTFTVHDTGEAF